MDSVRTRTRPAGTAPTADGARTIDDLTTRLRALRSWSGLSYRELHREVLRLRRARAVGDILPAYDTVHRCLQPGRTRLDADLVFDIARALLGDDARAAEWRQAVQHLADRDSEARVVAVADGVPDDLDTFTGRDAELTALAGVVESAGPDRPVVLAITGLAGVGKTCLAVRLAHRLLDTDAPGGVSLSANLRGFDPDRPPADPVAVLDGFLRALGVPGRQLAGLRPAERTALLGRRLAGRRAVILLDDAAGVEQVRQLLPACPNTVVLVTSRHALPGLATSELVLDVFTPEESLELLRRTAGADRVDADRDTAVRIAELVGRLPLALAMVAGRMGSATGWTFADHAERLESCRAGLRLDDAVAAALALSYDALPPGQRRLLRSLPLHPRRRIGTAAVAALLGTGLADAEADLAALCEVNLLRQPAPGQFAAHDLVLVFGANRSTDEDSARARRAATVRLYDFYRYTALVAMDRYAPQEAHRRPKLSDPGGPSVGFADRERAAEWLETERANLIAVAMVAADQGMPSYPVDLSAILMNFLDTAAHYSDGVLLHGRAAEVAEGSDRSRAVACLGASHWRLGRNADALACFESALRIAREAGDQRGMASALSNAGLAYERFGRYPEALDAFRVAAESAEEFGDRLLVARALNNRAVVSERLGRYDDAMAEVERCLLLSRDLGDAVLEGRALNWRGLVNHRLGRHAAALDDVTRAYALACEHGSRGTEGYALLNAGRASAALDRLDAAAYRLRALAVAREIANCDLESTVLNDIGDAVRRDGDHARALGHHRDSLAIAERGGDPYEQARAHDGIGACLAGLGDLAGARDELRAAATGFDALGTPESAVVAARLAELERY